MKYIITFSLLISTAHAQLNVKNAPFNAVGNVVADDTHAIQWAVDSAIKTGLKVYLPPGRYKTTAPIIAARRATNGVYVQSYLNIYGDDAMWSPGITKIEPTFKDAPAFIFHLNKGSKMRGIFFDGKYRAPNITLDSLYRSPIDTYGDSTCRDSQYSPYAAIAIDPFRYNLPPDGGYPTLQSWYGGAQSSSGSTGIFIEDCTFRNFTIGAILSPNGYTLNNELITFKDIRVNDCKFAFVGCQAQEKQNQLINWGIWGKVRCAFVWGKYGAKQPGHYNVTGVNIAGNVVQMVYRPSQGFFPLFMSEVFAENLGSIGYWNTSVRDALRNSSINFYWYKYLKGFPNNHLEGFGLSIYDCDLRYYGSLHVPVLLKGQKVTLVNVQAPNYVKSIRGWRYWPTDPDYQNGFEIKKVAIGIMPLYYTNGERRVTLTQRLDTVKQGDFAVFYQGSNLDYAGMGEVINVTDSNYTIGYISPGVQENFTYNVGIYKSK